MLSVRKTPSKLNELIGTSVKAALLVAALAALMLPAACTSETYTAALPTMSQQQIERKLSAMKYYYDTYGDIYAAASLRDMFEAGLISSKDYSGVYAQAGDALSRAEIKELHKLKGALNCQLTRLSAKDMLKCRLILSEAVKMSPVLISMFDAQQQRDELEDALKVIDKWALSPDEQNTKVMETKLESEALSCGAKVYLYYYTAAASEGIDPVSADGETYDPKYYIEAKLGGYLKDALYEVFVENNDKKVPAQTNEY
ncbi:MAG: hypothetical protein ACM3S4_10640 [Burkholderiales bacterium]